MHRARLHPAQQREDPLAELCQPGALLHEDLGGHSLALAHQSEKDVLGADVVVTELERFPQRELEHLLGSGREGDLTCRLARSSADDRLNSRSGRLQADAELVQCLGRHPVGLAQQTEEEVLGADVVVAQPAGLLLGHHDGLARPVGETLEHARSIARLSMRRVGGLETGRAGQ